MITDDNFVEQLEDGSIVREEWLHGRVKDVDLEAGAAVFRFLGGDRVLRFPQSLGEDVKKWEGRWVEITGRTTYGPDQRLDEIELHSIKHFSDEVDELIANLPGRSFDPKTMPRASFDFETEDFLRTIDRDRRGVACRCVEE